jgi:hypothetical protein
MMDWKLVVNELHSAPDSFLKAAGIEAQRRIETAEQAWWDNLEGCPEYDYDPCGWGKVTDGVLRVPKDGPWMYARCPILNKSKWNDGVTPKPTGRFHVFKHRRIDFPADFEIKHYSHGTVYAKGSLARERLRRQKAQDRLDAAWMAGRNPWLEEKYSITECRRQIQKHHPDKGGKADEFHIWKQRLEAAKQVAA